MRELPASHPRRGGMVLAAVRVDSPATAAPVERTRAHRAMRSAAGAGSSPAISRRLGTLEMQAAAGTRLAEHCAYRVSSPNRRITLLNRCCYLQATKLRSCLDSAHHSIVAHLSYRHASTFQYSSSGKPHSRPGLRQQQHRPSRTRRREPDPPTPSRFTAWMSHIRNRALTLATSLTRHHLILEGRSIEEARLHVSS